MDQVPESWRVYLSAKLEVLFETKWHCFHGCSPKRPLPRLLAKELRDCVTAYILTAWNPQSVELDLEENERRNGALQRDLSDLALPYYVARGSSLSDDYGELGYLVVSNVLYRQADPIFQLAKKYSQAAIYVIKDGVLSCVDSDGGLWVEMEDVTELLRDL